MFKKITETIIGGAIGALAIYAVGRVAYQAGQEVAREECRYHAMRKASLRMREKDEAPSLGSYHQDEALSIIESEPVHAPRRKQSKLGMIFGARKLFGNRRSVIGNLVQNPEEHKFEAFVEGDELQIHVKKKEAS